MKLGGSKFVAMEVSQTLSEHGYPIYLVCLDKRSHCCCYDRASTSADPACVKCFGTGYVISLIKTRAYSRSQVPPAWGNFGASYTESLGSVVVGGRYYYLDNCSMATAMIGSGDLVLEPLYNEAGCITGVSHAYRVSAIDAYRFNGQIVYKRIACSLLSTGLDALQQAFIYNLQKV